MKNYTTKKPAKSHKKARKRMIIKTPSGQRLSVSSQRFAPRSPTLRPFTNWDSIAGYGTPVPDVGYAAINWTLKSGAGFYYLWANGTYSGAVHQAGLLRVQSTSATDYSQGGERYNRSQRMQCYDKQPA